MKANDMEWPMNDGKFVKYPTSKKELWVYRKIYNSMAEDGWVAKFLREKCINNEMSGKWLVTLKVWMT
jgi:hypothetical protein